MIDPPSGQPPIPPPPPPPPLMPPPSGPPVQLPPSAAPLVPPSKASMWRRFRRLPLLGQIGMWAGVVVAALIVAAVVAGPPKKDASTTAADNSTGDVTVEATTVTQTAISPPAIATTTLTTPVETTTTVLSREAAIAAGNVASCLGGGFSDNTDFSATCSGAGDVAEWLAPYGECEDATVIQMSEDASCDSHGGFKALLASDYTPPTTTVPPTEAPTVPPPTIPNFGGGTQLVGDDVQPGIYVTDSIDGFGCYWERLSDVSGDFSAIIANANLSPGSQGIVEIAATDVAFNSSGCGQWVVFLPPPTTVTSFGEGVWMIGQQVVPGRYKSDPVGEFGCYWARLSGVSGEFKDILANDNVSEGSAIVQIKASDHAFESSGCGNWTLVQ